MSKNILITGANGQLGSEFKSLATKYPQYSFLLVSKDELDITNANQVNNYFLNNEVHYLINCAAYTAVDAAEENETIAQKINAFGPGVLAKACRKFDAVLLHVSTDYVFEGKNEKASTENDETNPISVYGKTKLEGEQAVLDNCPNAYIIRTSWLYSSFNQNFVKSMLRLGATKSELGIVADQFGSPTYAKDLAKAILTIIDKTKTKEVENVFGVYHYSNEGVITWCDFATKIMELGNTGCSIKPITTEEYPLPAARPKNSSMSKEKIRSNFKLEIPNWEDSLKQCMNQILVDLENKI